jgi:hypothetical protein
MNRKELEDKIEDRYCLYQTLNAGIAISTLLIGVDMSLRLSQRITHDNIYHPISAATSPEFTQALGLGLEVLSLVGFPILTYLEKRKEKALRLD